MWTDSAWAHGLAFDIAKRELGQGQPRARSSEATFPDGGSWRVEIPSVEGPEALEVVIRNAQDLNVPIHRVSQGSGVMMLRDSEIREMVQTAEGHSIDLCLFLGPRASWDFGGQRFTAGGNLMARARGAGGVYASIAEAVRAAELGVRSLLVADEGVLWMLHILRSQGELPPDLQLKVSVQAAPANPVSLRLLERLGADTVNVPSDVSISELAELRGAASVPMDFYVEAPDSIGGFVRHYDTPEIVRVAAPVYLKFGLRNAPDIYPSGGHMAQVVKDSAAERVRRAKLCLDLLERLAPQAATDLSMSPVGQRSQPAADRFQ